MKHTVLHRPVIVPASNDSVTQHDNKQHDNSQQDTGQSKTDTNRFFVAFGMRAGDLGYRHVIRAISILGEIAHFNEGLLYLTSTLSIDQVFQKINKSIVDPCIPSDVGLLIVDPKNARAKWYLNREISDVLIDNWHNQNNLFVCHNDCSNEKLVYDINALGPAIPLTEHIWYVSTTYTPGEAYQILSLNQSAEDRLTIFDATGRASSWQSAQQTQPTPQHSAIATERPAIMVQIPGNAQHLPSRATIHQPQSWQSSMLSEFL